MNYKEKARIASEEAHKKQVAVKLLDGIDKIILEATDLSARRWVWELMQNAKDVANEKVKLEIELGLDYVEFRHNGNPFEMEHLTYLIEQISTKERRGEDEQTEKKTTGQFGTGFMTTHLLSRVVDVEGVLYDRDTEVYKKFNLRLDRSAKQIDGMKKNVDLAFEVFDKLDNETLSPEIVNYNPNNNCDTKFRYILNSESLEIAKKGIDDLYSSLPFTLIFIPQIAEVKVINENKIDIFKNVAPKKEGEINISEIKVNKKTFIIAHISDDFVSIAIQLNKNKDRFSIEKPNVNVPTLFCDFPLIGSENFTFPVIVNSRYFYPTEPRDGIYLSDKEDDKINENKNLLIEAKDLYFKILEHASQNWNDIMWLAKTNMPENIDTEWFKENIQLPMREVLLKTAIVDTETERIILENAIIPFHSNKEFIGDLWYIMKPLKNNQLPKFEHIEYWYDLIDYEWYEDFDVNLRFEIKDLLLEIENFDSIQNLNKKINISITWLNESIDFIENKLKDKELLNIYRILPNQIGNLLPKSELLKEIYLPNDLQLLLSEKGKKVKEFLIDNEIVINLEKSEVYTKILNEIIDLLNENKNYTSKKKKVPLKVNLYSNYNNF